MLKAITIDFWNTLFDSSNGVERNNLRKKALFNEIDKFGISVKNEQFSDALAASWEYFNEIWLNQQRTPLTNELIDFISKYLNISLNDKAIERIAVVFRESILLYPPSLMPGVTEALIELSKKFKLAIISDTGFSPGYVLRELLKRNKILEYFQAFSFSDETGVSKPNKKAYIKVLDEIKCHPFESLHIGDIEKTDIIGAKSLGMKAILYYGDNNESHSGLVSESISDAQTESWSEIIKIISQISLY